MGEWRKTMCDLCPTGCGLEVLIEGNRIIKARGDKEISAVKVTAAAKALTSSITNTRASDPSAEESRGRVRARFLGPGS